MRQAAAAVAAWAALTAAAAAQDATPSVEKVRSLGLAIGNAYVCTEAEGRSAFREETHHLFDLILQDVGSDLGFIYATAL
ncbi:MAG: hypothetical protein AAFU61_11480, partial [Pseudomonadota bacterium]